MPARRALEGEVQSDPEGPVDSLFPELVVRVNPSVSITHLQSVCETVNMTVIRRLAFTDCEYVLAVLAGGPEAVLKAVKTLSDISWVQWAAPNRTHGPQLRTRVSSQNPHLNALLGEGLDAGVPYAHGDPNDEYFPRQWYLLNTGQSGGTPGVDINARAAWQITTGDPNIVIAIIDCGVDSNHPDLIHNLVPGYDFLEQDDRPDPERDQPIEGHGTACAGVAAAEGDNGIGVTGVAPRCKIMPIRICNARRFVWTDTEVATALRWAATHGADVLSNSWSWEWKSEIIHSAVKDVTRPGGIGRDGKGCVVVWAVNDWGVPIAKNWQEAYEEVIAVGAVDHNDVRLYFSGYGPQLDLMAPSSDFAGLGTIWTTDILGDAGFSTFNDDPNILDYTNDAGGTSMCAPMVAGIAALILSVDPDLGSEEVRRYLLQSAHDLGEPGRDDYYGWGRVDAGAALDMLQAERADMNHDYRVDLQDYALMAQSWPQKKTLQDLVLVSDYWLRELSLISHWPLDKTDNLTVYDAVTRSPGELHGNPDWQPESGRIKGALAFDGVDDYVRMRAVLNPEDGPFSVFIWVKGSVTGQTILAQDGGADWLTVDLLSGHLKTDLRGTDEQAESLQADGPVVTDDNWHQVGLTWDGQTRALYVDGVRVARDTQSPLTGSDGDLLMGTDHEKAASSFWYGLIDDVRIYNRALTENEVRRFVH